MPYIPLETLSECLKDPFYSRCCITGKTPVQFHENFQWGGCQVKEPWCILPLHKSVHDIEKRKDIREKLDWIMLSRAPENRLREFSKIENLIVKRDRLIAKYGKYEIN